MSADAIPTMVAPDQYPEDEYATPKSRRRHDTRMSVEAKELDLLREPYLAMYRFDKQEADFTETVERMMRAYDALNRFYSGETVRT